MRFLLSLVISLSVLASGAAAQEDDSAVRSSLSEQLIEVLVREHIDKLIMDMVEEQIAAGEVDDAQAAWTRENAPMILSRHAGPLIDEMETLYAERFTAVELQALLDLYATPEGRIIARKQQEIGGEQGTRMIAFLQAFAADYREKYCAAFECPLVAMTREELKAD